MQKLINRVKLLKYLNVLAFRELKNKSFVIKIIVKGQANYTFD